MTELDHERPISVELFPCAGGMAEGFKRAGVHFDLAIEWMKNHVESYETNIGHRPVCMDVRDFVRMLKLSPMQRRVRLLVADPPCTPWSRSGKRLGTDDHRDMLRETCDLIRLIRPDAYLIGNVPGLDDGPNLGVVQQLIGSLSEIGYCSADFARLNAANYGVPQHRIRPFWFGHLSGPCIMWPEPTHGDPDELRDQLTLPMVHALKPWITCGQALKHLTTEELGRPVKLRKREEGKRKADEFTLQDPRGGLNGLNTTDAPSHAIVRNTHGNGCIMTWNEKHAPADPRSPSPTVGARSRSQSAGVIMVDDEDTDDPVLRAYQDVDGNAETGWVDPTPEMSTLHYTPNHPPSFDDEPAMAVRAGGGEGARVALAINAPKTGRRRKRDDGRVGQGNRVGSSENASATITAKVSRVGAGEAHVLEWPWDRPATTVQGDDRLPPPGHHDEDYAFMSLPNAVVISEKAASVLQGFPDFLVCKCGRSTHEIPWEKHPKKCFVCGQTYDVQPWAFIGKTKKERWSQLGQAMPAPLAFAVATSVVRQLRQTGYEVPQAETRREDPIRAPGGDVGTPSASARAKRTRTPQERGSARQPTVESGDQDPSRSLASPHAQALGDEAMRGM
jgi:site-specific DNA-cytosine methylase